MLFSFLLASLVVLARALTDCEGNCVYQERKCVKDGGFCDEDSFDLYTFGGIGNIPCNGQSTQDRSACYICDTGTIVDDASSSKNRLCIDNFCTETGQNLDEPCCSDWNDLKGNNPRNRDRCDVTVQGKFCKPQFTCNWNSTTGIGMCEEFSTVGARYLLGLGEACTFYDPDILLESTDDLNVCDTGAGWELRCDVGQAGGNASDFYGREGTCKGYSGGFEDRFYTVSVECDNDNQCEFDQYCTGLDGTANNRTCMTIDPSFCENDNDCGWGVQCLWFNPSDTARGGVCGKYEIKKKGQGCNQDLDCVSGLYCNDGVCDSVEAICSCESEFDDCGRGKQCTCPNAALIGPKTKPSCNDNNQKQSADRSRKALKDTVPYYKCFNSSMVKKAAGNDAYRYFSVQDCFTSKTNTVPMTLQRYRADGAAQPSCPSGTGVSSALLGGASKYSNSASQFSPEFALIPLLLVVQAFFFYN